MLTIPSDLPVLSANPASPRCAAIHAVRLSTRPSWAARAPNWRLNRTVPALSRIRTTWTFRFAAPSSVKILSVNALFGCWTYPYMAVEAA